jgi:SMODS and SLOG-associating 2TM effector domain family 4
MFQLSLVDHIRLSFGSVVSAYEGHADAAARLARWSWYGKLATLSIIGLGGAASFGAMLRGGVYAIAAPVIAVIAFAGCAAYLAFDPETRVYAHRATAARLWLMCEKYRALLAEVHDELLELPAVAQRRDALLKEVAEIFEQAPPADRATFEIARKTIGGTHGGGYSDQQLDEFLPVSLRRTSQVSA